MKESEPQQKDFWPEDARQADERREHDTLSRAKERHRGMQWIKDLRRLAKKLRQESANEEQTLREKRKADILRDYS